MKLRAGLIATVAALAAGQRPQQDWDVLLAELEDCINSAGACAGADTLGRANCEAAGGVWTPAFASGAALQEAALGVARQAEAAESPAAHFVRVTDVAALRASAGPVQVVGLAPCETRAALFAVVDGTPADVAALSGVDAAMAIPARLKMSPHLERVESARAAKGQALERRLVLTASAQPRAFQVLQQWRERHEGRRRMLAAGGAQLAPVEFSLGRRLQDSDAPSDVIVASTRGPADALDLLGEELEAYYVEPVLRMRPQNLDAALVSQEGVVAGIDEAASEDQLALRNAGLTGKGQVVTVADTGLDLSHCFFRASADPATELEIQANMEKGSSYYFADHRKLVKYYAIGDNVESPSGHGTHVVGTLLGSHYDENDATAVQRGIAPDARVIFMDIGQPCITEDCEEPEELVLPEPLDLRILMAEIRRNGSYVHSNSWGVDENAYTAETAAYDTFLSTTGMDSVVVFAAGNTGESGAGSIGAPATCKNCIAVGAQMSGERPHALVGGACPEAGTCSTNNVASFSSSGPTKDGRIKPELVAPGAPVISATAGNDGTCGTSSESGTSMATPVVSGNVAIMRQFLTEGRWPTGTATEDNKFVPSGALLKAMAVHSAVRLTGQYGATSLNGTTTAPDMYQGFGAMQLNEVLLLAGNGPGHSVFLDGDMASQPELKSFSQTKEYNVSVPATPERALRVTVTWYDPTPALMSIELVINRLSLVVQAPDGTAYLPNGQDTPDRLNTVLQVTIPAEELQAGLYVVSVIGTSVLENPTQSYGLVISGDCTLEGTRIVDGKKFDGGNGGGVVIPPVPPTPPADLGDADGLGTGALAGIAAGILVVAGVVGVGAGRVMRKRRDARMTASTASSSVVPPPPPPPPPPADKEIDVEAGKPGDAESLASETSDDENDEQKEDIVSLEGDL